VLAVVVVVVPLLLLLLHRCLHANFLPRVHVW
jgi:hypothetical protein